MNKKICRPKSWRGPWFKSDSVELIFDEENGWRIEYNLYRGPGGIEDQTWHGHGYFTLPRWLQDALTYLDVQSRGSVQKKIDEVLKTNLLT